MDQWFLDNFHLLESIIKQDHISYLSGEYLQCITYIGRYSDIYNQLAERASKENSNVIKIDHIIQLTNLLIQISQDKKLGFDLESLINVRDTLFLMC